MDSLPLEVNCVLNIIQGIIILAVGASHSFKLVIARSNYDKIQTNLNKNLFFLNFIKNMGFI